MRFSRHRHLVYVAAVAPAFILLFGLVVVPLVVAVRTTIVGPTGFDLSPVRRAAAEPLVREALLWNTVLPLGSLAVEALAGLGLALWFYRLRRGRRFWTVVALVPFAVPEIVYLVTMKLLLREHGYLNSVLLGFGIEPVGWLQAGSALVPLTVLLVDAWRVTPIVFLICLAGLEQIPPAYLDAAAVDGASTWQVIRLIQVPLVLPAFLVAMALRSVDAFRIFATPFVLVGVDDLPVLTSVAYWFAYVRNDRAAGNVAALMLALVLFLAAVAVLLISSRGRRSEQVSK